jgi:hypothetical protein
VTDWFAIRPKDVFGDLLHLDNDGVGITSSLKQIEDGRGANTCLQLSNDTLKVTGNVTVTGTVTAAGYGITSLYDGTLITATGSTTARTLAARFADVVNALDYGAVGDGTTNNTTAIQAALDTGKSVFLPDGVYVIAGSLTMTSSGQVVYGSASGGSGSVLKFTGGGSATGLTIGTAAPASAVTSVAIRDLQIQNLDRTGISLFIQNASRLDIDSVTFATPYNALAITDCNTVRLNRISFVSVSGAYAIKWYGTGGTKNDILVLNEVQFSPLSTGASGRATAVLIDGFSHTLIINGFRAVRMGRGLHFTDSYAVSGENPELVFSNDMEVDFPEYEAIRVESGESLRFVNSYCHGSELADNIYIGAAAKLFEFNGGPITGAALHGVNCLGSEVYLRGTIARNSVAVSGACNGVEIGASASYVRIENGAIGRREALTGLQGYGVAIRSGATNVAVVANDLTGNATGPVLDASGVAGTTTVIGNVGTTLNWAHGLVFDNSTSTPAIYPKTTAAQLALRLKAIGDDYVYVSNGNGDSLTVGASTATLVNHFRIAGSAASSAPQMLAEGTDTNIDVRLTPKGTGNVRFGTLTATADAPITGYIEIKSATDGTVRKLAVIA